MIRQLRATWDRLSIYLPVILMGLLALSTYWLVRSTPVFEASPPDRPVRHEPDYFMQTFSIRTFDAGGRLRSEVSGAHARHYPDTDTLEIDQVRIRAFDEKGRLTTATANRALTNADASEVQLMGNARVVREEMTSNTGEPVPRMSFHGEFLHAFMDTERVKSHKPVELTRGQDHFTADSLDYDNVEQSIELRGRVRTTLAPAPGK